MKRSSLILAIAMSSFFALPVSAANDDAVIAAARKLQMGKKYNEAVKLYEANTKKTASERLYIDYATLLINLKNFKECEEMLNKAAVAYPESLRIKNALGQAKYKNGKISEASTLFSQVLGKDSNNRYAKAMLEVIRKEKASFSIPGVSNTDSLSDSGESLGEEDFSSSSSYGTVTFKLSNELSLEEQKELAKKLYGEMISLDKWATDDFISLHRQVIEKCHLTDQAQESCWRLSNLYLLGVEPAEYYNCIGVLEHLLKQYPDTQLMPDAKNRLLVVSSKIGDYTRVLKLYDELFERDPEPSDKIYMIRALDYGNALVAAGRKEEALVWYNRVLEKDNGKDSLEARAASKKISEL